MPGEQHGTHSWALLILKHDLETVLDRSRDNRGEDDGHLDGAEGAYVPLCCLQGREAEGWSAFTFWSRYLPWPHHGQSLCGWEELYVESQKQTAHPAVDYLSDMGRTFVFRCTQLPS